MRFKYLRLIIFLFLIICFSCSEEEEIVYRINTSRFYSLSRIAIDSTQIFRNNRNNTLNVEVRYQARIFNAAYDSIKWEFPGGTPNIVNEATETSVIYNKYGTYNAKMILLKYDTLSYGNIRLLVDTIPITKDISIKYKETNWPSYDSNSTWETIGSNLTYTNINSVFDNNNPLAIKTNFTGFENNRVRLKFDFKVVLDNPLVNSTYTNSQKKLELKIDDFTKFTVSRLENDKYYSGYIDISNKDAFELKFEVYPSLISSEWKIVNNGSNTPLYSFIGPTQENFLIGYNNLSTTSSVTIKLNNLSFGSSDMKNLKLSDTTKIILPEGKSKIMINMNDGLPTSFEIYNKNSREASTSLDNNEYFYRLFIKNLIIEVL